MPPDARTLTYIADRFAVGQQSVGLLTADHDNAMSASDELCQIG